VYQEYLTVPSLTLMMNAMYCCLLWSDTVQSGLSVSACHRIALSPSGTLIKDFSRPAKIPTHFYQTNNSPYSQFRPHCCTTTPMQVHCIYSNINCFRATNNAALCHIPSSQGGAILHAITSHSRNLRFSSVLMRTQNKKETILGYQLIRYRLSYPSPQLTKLN
jgi:hypothetical protein